MSSNAEYTGYFTIFVGRPLTTLNNSIKFCSEIVVSDFLPNIKAILYLFAPGALTLKDPEALSNNVESSVLFVILSVIVNPTLYDGVVANFSKTIVWASTVTKNPFI